MEESEKSSKKDIIQKLKTNPTIASVIVGFLVASGMTVLGGKMFTIYSEATEKVNDARIETAMIRLEKSESTYQDLQESYKQLVTSSENLRQFDTSDSVKKNELIISENYSLREIISTRDNQIKDLRNEIVNLKLKVKSLEFSPVNRDEAITNLNNEIGRLNNELSNFKPSNATIIVSLSQILIARDGYRGGGEWTFTIIVDKETKSLGSKKFSHDDPIEKFDLRFSEIQTTEFQRINIEVIGIANKKQYQVSGNYNYQVPKRGHGDTTTIKIPVLKDTVIDNGTFVFEFLIERI